MKTVARNALVVAAAALLMFCFVGCGSNFTIGEPVDDGVTFSLENGLDRGITAISVKNVGSSSFGAALSQDGELQPGEAATLNCAIPAAEEPAENSTASTMELGTSNLADMQVQTTGGTVYELHMLDLADIKDATLRVDGNMAYLEYTSVATGEQVSSLANEQDLKQALDAKKEAEKKAAEEAAKAEEEKKAAEKAKAEEEKKAAEEAAAKAAEEEAARQAAEEEAARQAAEQEAWQNQQADQSWSEPSQSGGGNYDSSGEDEACVDDLLFND